MTDNVAVTPGVGADIAADDVAGVFYQRVKLDIGGDGAASPVIAGNGLPVAVESLPGTVATDVTAIKTAVEILDNAISGTEMQVDIVAALPAGTNAIGGVTGTIAHDSATTANPLMQGGYASAAAPTSVNADGDAVRAWFLRNGAQANVLTAAGALIGGDATNGLDVDVTRIIPGTGATNLGKAIDTAVGATDTGVAALVVRDDVLGTITPADNDFTVLRVDLQGRLWTHGQIAHDSAISGAPFRIGGRAVSADFTAVTTGDQADLICDLNGKQIILPYAIPENHWQAVTAAKTDTADTAIKASAGAGLRNYITSITVTNSHATVGTVVEVKDGSTVIHRGYAAPAGGGYTATFPTPLKGTAATAINVANITTGSNTYVSMSGYTAP